MSRALRWRASFVAALAMLALVAFDTRAYALDGADWGVTIDSATTMRRSRELDDTDWEQRIRAALWAEAFWQLYHDGTLTVTAEGSYTYSDDRDYLFDVDRLRMASVMPGALTPDTVLSTTLGRFVFRDPTGTVLSHVADGVRIAQAGSAVEVELSGAYTGLLLNPSSSIRMSAADIAEDDDDDEHFGPRRILGQLELRLPDLPGRQRVAAALLAQRDLRDADDTEDTVNSQYYTLFGAGPLFANAYHSTFVTLATLQTERGDDDESLTALSAGTRLRYLREDWLASRFGIAVLYGSGPGDKLDRFLPITQPPTGTVFQPRIANLLTFGASYALRPWIEHSALTAQNVEFGAGARVFLRAQDDSGIETGGLLAGALVDPDSSKRYLGTELELALRARLLPDLGASLTGGMFLPGDSLGDDAEPEYLARFELSLSL